MQNILQIFLLLVEIASSFLLITVILIQKSKGGGLGGSAFGGGGNDSMFGARAGNVLTKITIGLSILFLANTLVLAFIYAGQDDQSLMDVVSPPITPVEPVVPEAPELNNAEGPAVDATDVVPELTDDEAEGITVTVPTEPGETPEPVQIQLDPGGAAQPEDPATPVEPPLVEDRAE